MEKIKYILVLLLILILSPIQKANALVSETIDPRGLTKDSTGNIVPQGYCFNILKEGTQGPEVEDLQTILKSDPTIYPEGLVTGYYGALTKQAVKRLQRQFNLSQTGEVDENTANIIMPCPIDVNVSIISPNGGEVWDRKNTHTITWKLSRPIQIETEKSMLPLDIEKNYFWPRGTIDLIEVGDSGQTNKAKHIATVNLAYQSYDWKIDSSISNGTNYKVRIGLGPIIACKGENCPQLYNPKFTFGDESDKVFTITGQENPPPQNLNEAINIVQNIIDQMQKLLALLKSMQFPVTIQ